MLDLLSAFVTCWKVYETGVAYPFEFAQIIPFRVGILKGFEKVCSRAIYKEAPTASCALLQLLILRLDFLCWMMKLGGLRSTLCHPVYSNMRYSVGGLRSFKSLLSIFGCLYRNYIWCRVAGPWDPPPRRGKGHYPPPPPCGTVVLLECRGNQVDSRTCSK